MKLGVLSDTHEDVANLESALDAYRAEGITQIIHCGDLTSADTARCLEGFEVVYVDGNMDQDLPEIYRTLRDLNPHSIVLPTYEGDIGGVSIGVTHGAKGNEFRRRIGPANNRSVSHGHTHRGEDE